MRLEHSDPQFENTLVFLDGKWCRGAVAADDVEGWVEIVDLASLAPLEKNEATVMCNPGDEAVTEWDCYQTKRKYGKVVQTKYRPADGCRKRQHHRIIIQTGWPGCILFYHHSSSVLSSCFPSHRHGGKTLSSIGMDQNLYPTN